MENSIKLAETLYGRSGVSKMHTQVIKTKGGNYIYRHVIAGNSYCDTRVFNPVTGEDRFAADTNQFNYLSKVVGVPFKTIESGVTGKNLLQ